MCPLWPIHLFFMYALVLGPLWFFSATVVAQVARKIEPWGVEFTPSELLELPIDSYRTVDFTTTDLADLERGAVTVESDHDDIASAGDVDQVFIFKTQPLDANSWTASFNVTGHFLGYAKIRLKVRDRISDVVLKESNPLDVTVVRQMRVIDHVFTGSVATLVSIIYINFGCALDWDLLRKTIKRPIGPAIGFVSQFVFMPLMSFGLGKLLFPDSVQMQLGMFFTGVSPAGGASNIWTYALGGNLNLSITMTTISTFAAFAMMPFWIFTLGKLIFMQGDMVIPYSRIAGFAVGLVIPLSIGFLIQRYLPRVSKFMVRILKPFSTLLILFIVIFAIVTNLYLFKLFSWRIVVAGLGLPWIGFAFGMLAARVFRQPGDDILAIAVETGIQNTGIAIFLLRTLGQPDADLTTVIPVSVAIMTPFPLMILLIYRKWWTRGLEKKHLNINVESNDGDDMASDGMTTSTTAPFANANIRKY